MTRKIFVALFLLFVLGVGIAYGVAREITVGMENNNNSLKVKKGNILAVSLEANASTGYTWDVSAVKKRILQYKGKKYIQPAETGTPIVGASGKEVLRFKAVRRGTSTIKLIYHQPWDKKAKPAKTFTIKVTVR
jgi:inhibitor of cysteine peptidase